MVTEIGRNVIDGGGVIVAVIAAVSAFLSQKSAQRAHSFNIQVETRLDAEKEAYQRAREFDTETIKRQQDQIDELVEDNKNLSEEVKSLKKQVANLMQGFPKVLREMVRDHVEGQDDKE